MEEKWFAGMSEQKDAYGVSQKILWNHNWHFTKLPLSADPLQPETWPTDTRTEEVTLPHDWLIGQAQNLYEDSWGVYECELPSAPSGRRLALRFEGVYMDSTLYVNGRQVGTWKYGYSTFEYDVTDYLTEAVNHVRMTVRYQSPNSRWYSGAGIYRNVWLINRPSVYIPTDGVYAVIRQEGDSWQVNVTIEIEDAENALKDIAKGSTGEIVGANQCVDSNTDQMHGYQFRTTILDVKGTIVAGITSGNLTHTLTLSNPHIWDQETPYLYTLRVALMEGDTILDRHEERIGFRTIHYDPAQGFFLNGRHVKLNGACMHHDLGCLGAAVHKDAIRRQFALLREMGVNAVRTSHNMPSVELMDMADETGMLIVSESFDMWEHPKTTYDYARFFKDWMAKDVASWIRRDRNRPSIILWSIGNEIYDTHASAHGEEITRALMAEVRKYDPAGNAPMTIGSNFMPWQGAQNCADIVKYAGYNYSEKLYREHHAAHPDWLIYGSETASTVQSRGIYHFPLRQSTLADEDEQCSSLGNSTTSWGARSTEGCIIDDRDTEFSAGQFIWTGFDYIGEPTPYHTKNSYFGQIDTAGFPKDSFYIYKGEWTDYRTDGAFVHLFPYWDFSEGQLVDVRIATNAPEAELFVNGRSLGRRTIDHLHGRDLVPSWQVPYEKGEIRAVAYDETGRKMVSETRHSFGDAAAICLQADRKQLPTGGALAFLTISMKDAFGYPVENANNRVRVTVEGPGTLAGLDNGDSTDFDEYTADNRRLFSGRLLAVIQSGRETGLIRVKVEAPGLVTGELQIPVVGMAADGREAAAPVETAPPVETAATEKSAAPVVTAAPREAAAYDAEVPIRCIEILPVAADGHVLTAEDRIYGPGRQTKCYRAIVHPADASYDDVTWRVTTDTGVNTNLATLEVIADEKGNHMARVTAGGDGDFRIRCSTRNGGEKTDLFWSVDAHAEGLGAANIDPYTFVSASLCSLQGGPITNGNEQGIATSREAISWVGFERVDFGTFGSDLVNLPIFELDNSPFDVEIWDGVPEAAGSELVCKQEYRIPSIWNTYQAMDFHLSHRLKGMHTLCFLTRAHKMHLKGFCFAPPMKAYARLSATDCDAVYGDSFTREADAITGIGNNVSLVFEDMDFGSRGAVRLVICGRTPLAKNTIHVRFASEDGESRQIAEFAGGGAAGPVVTDGPVVTAGPAVTDGTADAAGPADYVAQTFTLEPVYGRQTVTFVFMPGCQFDFAWFRFE